MASLRIVTVVGARPQFIKAAPVSRALAARDHVEIVVHTGQHYDRNMSQVFFEELGMAGPAVNLGVGSGPHGTQTARMLEGIEGVLLRERPDLVLVYGDTNSTIAGALAACKLGIRLAHVEAGLRSFNRAMPEEHNRVLTDHCSDLLFCPTPHAVENLAREGIIEGVHLVGDTMYDASLRFAAEARRRSSILADLELMPGRYLLATVHRAYNTDDPARLRDIFTALSDLDEPVIVPLHPRTRQRIRRLQGSETWFDGGSPVRPIDPVGYLDMLALQQNARVILTDSGGIQKEAYFFGVPCVTLRPETEWVETVESGWNRLVDNDREAIRLAVREARRGEGDRSAFGDGQASVRILDVLERLVA